MENQLGARARSKKPNEHKRKLDTPNCHQSQDSKKTRRAMEVMSLNTKIERSETAINKLRAHIKDGTCPKTLRYNMRANITPDEQFKKEIDSIRKTAITHLQSKCTKVERNCLARKTKLMLFKLEKSGCHQRLEMEIYT